ncbi:MAG: TadE/TadG family type IV pilus assembly protein [Gemmatimonadota bacterium]|nr:TadE/TadG family type IV pilus assembly protein [Gemmatimonadota bacterium]
MTASCLLRPVARGDRGQSLVEFAIVLPILLALVVGIFEFGRSWNVYQVLTNSAREGARLGVIPTTSEAEVRSTVESYLVSAALDPALAEITIDGVGGGVGTPTTVQVRYPYEFALLGPVVGMLGDSGIPGSVTLTSTAVMRNE